MWRVPDTRRSRSDKGSNATAEYSLAATCGAQLCRRTATDLAHLGKRTVTSTFTPHGGVVTAWTECTTQICSADGAAVRGSPTLTPRTVGSCLHGQPSYGHFSRGVYCVLCQVGSHSSSRRRLRAPSTGLVSESRANRLRTTPGTPHSLHLQGSECRPNGCLPGISPCVSFHSTVNVTARAMARCMSVPLGEIWTWFLASSCLPSPSSSQRGF